MQHVLVLTQRGRQELCRWQQLLPMATLTYALLLEGEQEWSKPHALAFCQTSNQANTHRILKGQP